MKFGDVNGIQSFLRQEIPEQRGKDKDFLLICYLVSQKQRLRFIKLVLTGHTDVIHEF